MESIVHASDGLANNSKINLTKKHIPQKPYSSLLGIFDYDFLCELLLTFFRTNALDKHINRSSLPSPTG